MTLTVHMIANAHLDPVWLWHWQRGADEALATCRVACDLLDEFPEFVYTRGEAWVYEQVRRLEPELLDRIRPHVESGRWAVVNGWWVQPDCNLPTAEAMAKSARLGADWFRRHLNVDQVEVAYCVDSFGHGPYLPSIIRAAGQKYYVMMRPGPSEKTLPAQLFRWRDPAGAEVLTFRILNSYTAWTIENLEKTLRDQLAQRQPGLDHVMVYYGAGNHGGGPTRKMVRWILEHRDYAPGVRLEFSSPQRYFAAVESKREQTPVVADELQFHAIGCYSVCGDLKRALRQAELAASAAERLLACSPRPADPEDRRKLDSAWEIICFNQFHDVLPGSAVASAVAVAREQVGAAKTLTEEVNFRLLRRDYGLPSRARGGGHRVHLFNPSDRPWAGLAEVDIDPRRQLLADEAGKPLPFQIVPGEPPLADIQAKRALTPVTLNPGEHRLLRLLPAEVPPAESPTANAELADFVLRGAAAAVKLGPTGIEAVRDEKAGRELLVRPLVLAARRDWSDTWSHIIDRYSDEVVAAGRFGAPAVVESGPLRTTVRQEGTIGRSRAWLFTTLEQDEPVVWLRLRINYAEPMTVLKAQVAPAGGVRGRADRVAGGWFDRQPDGKEYPLHHAVRIEAEAGALGLVLPDSFALDVTPEQVNATLIRNNFHALHNCSQKHLFALPALDSRFGTDEGPQEIRLALAWGEVASQDKLENLLARRMQPPHEWDDYAGISRVQHLE